MSDTDTKPWYKQFWPWFIIALPASVVVAGLTTVYIAFNNADTLVNDNYYKDGLAINRTLEQDARARDLGLEAQVRFDTATGEVFVTVAGDAGDAPLELLLLHPVDAHRDRQVLLTALAGGRYRADLDSFPRHRYYLRLQPTGGGHWRLNGELDLGQRSSVVLGSDA